MRGTLSMAAGRSTFGAERKDVTLLTDVRSTSENGHSRYGHPTARFAPKQPEPVAGQPRSAAPLTRRRYRFSIFLRPKAATD